MLPFTLAQLTDPHLTLAGLPPGWRDLPIKRALGRLSWHANRHRIHRQSALRAVVSDLKAAHPDHVVVTGDLTNLALPAEFVRAAEWLATLGDAAQVSVVPGNHDAMVRTDWNDGVGRWAAYMTDDAAAIGSAMPFPYLRRRGAVALIGLSSAVPSPPFRATGLVGPAQSARLGVLLDAARDAGLCRVVLLHHPPVDGITSERKALLDRGLIQTALARHGAELVLCGHTHFASLHSLPGPGGPVPVLVGPSASAVTGRAVAGTDPGFSSVHAAGRAAGWCRISIERAASGWLIDLQCRQLTPLGGLQDTLKARLELPV